MPQSTETPWQILSPHLSERRKERFKQVASRRTDHISLVLQDIHDPHNISACIRSAEAMGIHNIHVISQHKPFKASTASRGSRNWVHIFRHKSIEAAIEHLKEKSYRLYAAMPPHEKCVILDSIPIEEPVALVFGNEHAGIDPQLIRACDGEFTIPMSGMVESFNISVAAAISMYSLSTRCHKNNPDNFFIPQHEQQKLLNAWSIRDCRKAELILKSKEGAPVKDAPSN